jgi:PEP-CTERM motif
MKSKIALAVALLVAGTAQAATTAPSSFSNPLSVTDFTVNGSLSKFDAALGTLTGATLVLSDSMLTDYIFKNNAASAQTFTFNTSLDMDVTSTVAGVTAAIAAGPLPTIAYSQRVVALASQTNSTLYTPALQSQTATYNLSGAVLAALTGSGTFGLTCTTMTGSGFVGGGGNIVATQNTKANCGASIVYTYTVAPPVSVPVPASVALLGLGLLAAAGAARRRQA